MGGAAISLVLSDLWGWAFLLELTLTASERATIVFFTITPPNPGVHVSLKICTRVCSLSLEGAWKAIDCGRR